MRDLKQCSCNCRKLWPKLSLRSSPIVTDVLNEKRQVFILEKENSHRDRPLAIVLWPKLWQKNVFGYWFHLSKRHWKYDQAFLRELPKRKESNNLQVCLVWCYKAWLFLEIFDNPVELCLLFTSKHLGIFSYVPINLSKIAARQEKPHLWTHFLLPI